MRPHSEGAGGSVPSAPIATPFIELHCPKCKNTKEVCKSDDDPVLADVMEIICPSCDDGDRHSPRYFTDGGAELLFGRDFGQV